MMKGKKLNERGRERETPRSLFRMPCRSVVGDHQGSPEIWHRTQALPTPALSFNARRLDSYVIIVFSGRDRGLSETIRDIKYATGNSEREGTLFSTSPGFKGFDPA